MSTEMLFIPDRIKVGYDERNDTYTKKLAYVIYFDKKGVLRKETSWEQWRDKKIEPNEYTNEPTEGFVLNKGVGGTRHSYGWNPRNEYIRVYDPRGFEFEISVANLLFILRECDCSRGKGLQGKFVYSWDKTELVLLPVGSQEYKKSAEYTDLQGKKLKIKDLVLGAAYLTRQNEELIYLGKFDYYENLLDRGSHQFDKKFTEKQSKRHIFWSEKKKGYQDYKDASHLAAVKNPEVSPNYAHWVDLFNKSKHGSKVAELILRPLQKKDIETRYEYTWKDAFAYNCTRGDHRISTRFFVKNPNDKNQYIQCFSVYLKDGTDIGRTIIEKGYKLQDGAIVVSSSEQGVTYKQDDAKDPEQASYYQYGRVDRHHYYGYNSDGRYPWIDFSGMELIARFESGVEARVMGGSFIF